MYPNIMADDEPRAKKSRTSILSDHVLGEKFQDIFHKHWSNQMSIEGSNMQIYAEPFRVAKISNFIANEEFMEEFKTELSDILTKRIHNDLYQFEQTNDLVNFGSDCLVTLHHTFSTEMVAWMERVTNIELNSTISMTSSCYYDGDYLLCHDDNMGDRRIAFVLYLTRDWTKEDGGTLDIFDTDEKGLPRNIVHSIIPEYNSLVFFEVSDCSYHQVAEVTSAEFSRWTINGWFHGPKKVVHPPRPEIQYEFIEPIDSDEDLKYWIMESYLCAGIGDGIRSDVERQSYAYLAQFFKEKIYAQLSKELLSSSIKWKRVGPPNLRNYEIAEETSLPDMLKDFLNIFKTLQFFTLLKKYTELDLVPDGENMKPKMTVELQRWSKGCYTLICDKPTEDGVAEEQGVPDDQKPNINTNTEKYDYVKPPKQNNDVHITDESKGDKNVEKTQEPCDIWTSNNDNNDEDKVLRSILKDKKPKVEKKPDESEEASCSKSEDYSTRSPPLNPDSEDSEVSDIGDYLSGSSKYSEDDEKSVTEPGTLDVIMHFHTSNVPDGETIDYVDPKEPDGALIHVTPEDNHLCLVYKVLSTCRFQKYINHYCEGYFYNLICTYYEK